MKVTCIGHAGLRIETSGGTILCDPWFNPAFFGAWYPFPRNDHLDMAEVAACDFLYISHTHRDHFDRSWLAEHVDPSVRVLLPEFGIGQLRRELTDIGFTNVVPTRDRVPVELDGGLRVAIISLAAPHAGPMGDSALLVRDPTATVFDQNDAHPSELGVIPGFEQIDGHFLQHSGAIWYPMVYAADGDEQVEAIAAKRDRQRARALDFVDMIGAPHVFPSAGPPCFLDDELFDLNDLPDGPPSIFTDASWFAHQLRVHGHDGGHVLLPGSTATLVDGDCVVSHRLTEADRRAPFEDKRRYLETYRRDTALQRAIERAAWSRSIDDGADIDLVEELASWIEPLLENAPHTRRGVGAVIGLDAGDIGVLLDLPDGTVRRWEADEPEPPFVFTIPRALLEAEVAKREPDWCNDLFLSCRFRARRAGDYNEYVYTFFKSLSAERMRYAEAYYASRLDGDEDIEWIEVGGWEVEARCPHQGASLRRVGSVEHDTLTCGLHGYRFDLTTGRCLDAEGVALRVRGRTGSSS